MASLKSLRMRINSVKSTRKITQAMKMVAAAKLRRAQSRAEAARPYAERMERMLASLGTAVAGQPDAPRLLVGTGGDAVHLLVVISGDRGLAGAFNTTLLGPGGLPVQPLLPVTITVSYSSTPTCPTIPGSLGLWRLNGSIWEPVPSEDNAAAQVLTATLTHFSSFAIFGETRPLYLPSVVRAE